MRPRTAKPRCWSWAVTVASGRVRQNRTSRSRRAWRSSTGRTLAAAADSPVAAAAGRLDNGRVPAHRPQGPAAHPRRLLLRAVHGDAGQHGRERGPAQHPAGAGGRAVGAGPGPGRLHPGVRQPAADRRLARRPVRPPAGVPDRPGGVHRLLGPVRPRPDPAGAGRRPGPPGGGGGRPAAQLPGHPDRGLPRPARAGPGHRPVVGGVGDGPGRRPGGRRAAHRRPRLALGVLREPARRGGRLRGRRAGRGRVPRPGGQAAWTCPACCWAASGWAPSPSG